MKQNVRVLIVDDDEKIGHMFQTIIQEEGVAADFVSTGEEALRNIQGDAYDVIFIDMVMPRMSGIEVAEKIRECGKSTPLVLMSGYSMDDVHEKIKQFRIHSFLKKPVKISQIMEVIHTICDKK